MRRLGCLLLLFVSGCDCAGDPALYGDGGEPLFDGAPPPIEGLVSMRIEPADARLVVEGGVQATQTYTAIGAFEDGTEADVTPRVSWGLRSLRRLGTFRANVFTTGTSVGGRGVVEATAGDVYAETSVTVQLRQTVSVPPADGAPIPDEPGALFGGPEDPARAPTLVYPNDGVVLPPNLGRVEVHWLRGSEANTLFEVAFENDLTDVRAHVRCERPEGVREDGCVWEPAGAQWTWIADTNAGGAPLRVTVRGTDDEGSAVGASSAFEMRFGRDPLSGTIYYWTVSEGGRIMRYDFGAGADAAERVMGPELAENGRCVGCHALSRDGRKLVGSVGGQNRGGMILMDLESFTPVFNASSDDDHILQFAAFAPDGDSLVGVYGDDTGREGFGDLFLFDTRCDAASLDTCGQQTGRIDLGGREASHPDWSPDGSRIAFTDVGHHRTSQRPGHGAIAYVAREGDGWSAPVTLVERGDGLNRYNPAWAVDSSFLLFDESVCPGGDVASGDCNADTDPTATIWAIGRDGGAPVRLARAQARGALDETDDLANTFPRFAPFEFVLGSGDLGSTRVMWVSFSSTRRYGLRETPSSSSGESDRGTWLWMTAVEPEAAARGEDPSHAAFALPFQDLATSNHIAVWTTESVGEPPIF